MSIKVERWSEPHAPDAGLLRRRLEAEGYSVFQWTDAPGSTYADHAHAEDQSHWVISGALGLTVDGREYILRAGDRDYLPANTIHAARVVGSEPAVYLIGAKN
jgi:quercetin dioxygenase-like cupin family protein